MDDLKQIMHKELLKLLISESLSNLKTLLAEDGAFVDFSFEIKKIDFDIVEKRIKENKGQRGTETPCKKENHINMGGVKIFAEEDKTEE